MPITDYKVVKAPLDQIGRFMVNAIADGWQPYGQPFMLYPDDKTIHQAVVKGTPDLADIGSVPGLQDALDELDQRIAALE